MTSCVSLSQLNNPSQPAYSSQAFSKKLSKKMAFVGTPTLPQVRRLRRRKPVCAQYLSPGSFNVQFDVPSKAGSFGGVFFGQYADPGTPAEFSDVVVKCPIESDIGRQLYGMEKYTNLKLLQKLNNRRRVPEYLGEVIVPQECNLVSGLVRLGLVWQRVGSGETLEDYLSSSRIGQLASLLGTIGLASPLRRELTANVLFELVLVLQDLQSCGIVHRDVKPENVLVVSGDPYRAPFKAIDFGSSCDWSSPFKKGLGLATCDPIYTAPERRLDIFKPAYRFDVYSIGLIALRCALPSLTDNGAMKGFVENILSKSGFSFVRVCSAVTSGRAQVSPSVKADFMALTGPYYQDMYALFATMLTEDPGDRADVSDCIQSRFVCSAKPSGVL